MPQGNHHMLPSGLWHRDPSPQTLTPYILKTFGKAIGFFVVVPAAWCSYRYIANNMTHTNFIGRTIVHGRLTVLNHEPLSAAEIDKLKAASSKKQQ